MTPEEADWQSIAKFWLTVPIKNDFNCSTVCAKWDVALRETRVIYMPARLLFGFNKLIKVYDSPLPNHKQIDEFPSTFGDFGGEEFSNPLIFSQGTIFNDCWYKLPQSREEIKIKTANEATFRAIKVGQDTYGWFETTDSIID